MSEEHVVCEMPDSNPPETEIAGILNTMKTVAIVGMSNNPGRDSYRVAAYMKEHGYRIVPVNPALDEVLGEKSYPDLASIPFPVDIVDIFRKIEILPGVVDEAIGIKAKAVWMQLGLAHHVSAEKARAAGLKVVQSRCLKVEHQRLLQHSEKK